MSDFWSRRRAAVEAEARAEEQAQIAAEVAAHDAELAERSDEELLAEAGMPEPETLDSADAVQAFLKSGLPQRLKTRALRRLWRLNPVLANLDGLVDYGEDYTDAATVIEDLQTVYQVGKGMLAKLEELGAAEEAEALASSDEAAPDNATPDLVDAPADTGPQSEPLAALPPDLPDPDPEPVAASGRRMRFRFEPAEGLT